MRRVYMSRYDPPKHNPPTVISGVRYNLWRNVETGVLFTYDYDGKKWVEKESASATGS